MFGETELNKEERNIFSSHWQKPQRKLKNSLGGTQIYILTNHSLAAKTVLVFIVLSHLSQMGPDLKYLYFCPGTSHYLTHAQA